MLNRDPVAQMCADMGLPPPRELMRVAREAASGTAGPARCPTWPPGFVPQVPDMMADEGRKTASGSAAERSRKASEARQAAADAGQGWGKGTALDTPAAQAMARRPRARAGCAAAPAPAPAKLAEPAYQWRGHSVGYGAWCALRDRGPMYEAKLREVLGLPRANLIGLLAKPLKAGVLVADRGVDKKRLWRLGPTPATPPVTSGTRLGETRRQLDA